MDDRYDPWSWLIIGIVLVAVALALFAVPAKSHDWYPMECCSGTDCAPIEKAEFIQPMDASNTLPQLVVTTRIGTTIVPKTATWRESKDNRMHACIKPYDKNPATNFICIFAPPSM